MARQCLAVLIVGGAINDALSVAALAFRGAKGALVEAFREMHAKEAAPRMMHLEQVAWQRNNTFAALMEVAKVCSLGTMCYALYDVGGEYWKIMS